MKIQTFLKEERKTILCQETEHLCSTNHSTIRIIDETQTQEGRICLLPTLKNFQNILLFQFSRHSERLLLHGYQENGCLRPSSPGIKVQITAVVWVLD